MAVKVDDGHGTVGTVDGAQQGEGDGVVTAEGDDTGQRPRVLGRALLRRIRGRLAGEDVEVALLDLVKSPGVVIAISM